MRRNSFHTPFAIAGAALAAVLLIVGGLLLWGSAYVHNTVQGQQAESYADHFIAVHIQDMAGGKTYSQLSAQAMAQPGNAKLAGMVSTVFKGETLRSMLLNAYGWWKVSQITYIASLVMFGLGGLALIGSVFALATGRRTKAATEALARTGREGQVKAA